MRVPVGDLENAGMRFRVLGKVCLSRPYVDLRHRLESVNRTLCRDAGMIASSHHVTNLWEIELFVETVNDSDDHELSPPHLEETLGQCGNVSLSTNDRSVFSFPAEASVNVIRDEDGVRASWYRGEVSDETSRFCVHIHLHLRPNIVSCWVLSTTYLWTDHDPFHTLASFPRDVCLCLTQAAIDHLQYPVFHLTSAS